jgi:diguanylate cyclase (GGDEF)-like protein
LFITTCQIVFVIILLQAITILLLVNKLVFLKRESDELQILSTTDHLTGLPNRRSFEDMLTQVLKEAKRMQYNRHAVAIKTKKLFLIDLDYFKAINDTYGHNTGDEALRVLVDAIKSTTRDSDVLARMGGDEFALLAETTDDGELALAEKIRSAVKSNPLITKDGDSVTLSMSIGGIRISGSYDDLESLIEAADVQLYRAKDAGRDCCCFETAGQLLR